MFKLQVKLLSFALMLGSFGVAQAQKEAPAKAPVGWHHLDMKKDGQFGISTEQAYEQLKGMKSQKVVVAVIDDGVDINHEDLKSVIWTNPKEIADNGIDDDKNGYVDDIHGWNFIGGKAEDIDHDSKEITRLYRSLKTKYENADPAKVTDKAEYDRYLSIKKDFEKELKDAQSQLDMVNAMEGIFKGAAKGNPMVALSQVKTYLKTFKPATPAEKKAKTILKLQLMAAKGDNVLPVDQIFAEAKEQMASFTDYHLNVNYDPRAIVGDDYVNVNERIYGNNRVISHNGDHGTHVAGLIGADRKNDIGGKGVADNVAIMAIRVVPDGDERDKDVANAIRYAADNGAKVVNMSFGKSYALNKKVVDDAVKYAASKDVLLVHAAGNDGKNNDKSNNFPNDKFEGGGEATNWIEVGASNWKPGADRTANFSNYGKTGVDVFSPGVDIFSSTKGDKYDSYPGTSMASPIVAGTAALIRSYFPALSASEVKEIIIKSAVPVTEKVKIPGSKKKTKFSELCVSGGIVNAAKAVEMAKKK
ncbi:MAG: S8 family peptidase [Bacteroidia bacterium]|nr:S8 family peptidase [Bacteroidia bacterium]